MAEDLKGHVRARYGAIAGQRGRLSCGCSSNSCCGSPAQVARPVPKEFYSGEATKGVPDSIVLTSLGCGNPTAIAQLVPGEIVLDLGSGGGLDAMIAAKRVAPSGKVYGLDMTPEMIDLARRNQQQAGVENAEFLLGDIEEIPLSDNSVDVIMSNCVINLAPDKDAVLREAYRVLKPGGRLAISDTVFLGESEVPDELRNDLNQWSACISGSLTEAEYLAKLHSAGFQDAAVEITHEYDAGQTGCCSGPKGGLTIASALISGRKNS